MGFIFLMGLSALLAILLHLILRRYVLASLVSAFVTTAAHLFITWIELGHFDRFAGLGIAIYMWCGLAVAFLIGLPFQLVRRRSNTGPESCNHCGYLLRGNLSGTCPECGTSISIEQQQKLHKPVMARKSVRCN